MKTKIVAMFETAKSEQAVSKQAPRRFSKLTATYWRDKVFQAVFTRDGIKKKTVDYYVQIQHAGHRRRIPLRIADRDKAAQKAAAIYQAILTKGWDAALAELDPDRAAMRNAATVGDVVAAIMSAGLRKRTAENYCNALRWFAARAVGIRASRKEFGPTGSRKFRARIEPLPLPRIGGALAQRILNEHVAKAGNDELAARRARISAHSFLVNARAGINAAIATGRIDEAMARMFEGVRVKGDRKPPKYRSTFDAAKLLTAAKTELRDTNPDAWLTILLALGAGLRRGEIQNLRWQHVNTTGGFIDVAAGGSWRPKTDSSENIVHVDAGLLKELELYRGEPTATVLRQPSRGVEDAVTWLRRQGITASKPLHTLRKEFGSMVYAATDLLVAAKQLRHSTTKVTESFYVEPRKQYAPPIGQMLSSDTDDAG